MSWGKLLSRRAGQNRGEGRPRFPQEGNRGRGKVWKADLIVVGSHGYPTWERLLLGSVSQAVVSHAKCSVEVVRLPEQKQAAK